MKYVVIGAVAGGASAAARLRRLDEKAKIVIFEKGEYISYANCGLPYYIGNIIKDRNALFVQTASAFNSRFNIDVRIQTEVIAIDTQLKTVTAFNQQTGEIYTETYDKLILSPGAEPIKPPLPGINQTGIFTLRNVNDTDYIKAYVQQENVKSALVIGAGFIGLEMAENLHEIGLNVTIVEMGNQILAPLDLPLATMVQQHVLTKGVGLKLNTAVTGFEKEGNTLMAHLNNGETIQTDVVIMSIGVKPDTRLATMAGLKLGVAKGIWVNEYLQTSNPDVYAVGDAIEFMNPITQLSMSTYLAGPANKQGRICANNIVLGNKQSYKGAINTAIVKVFDLTVAATGVASKHLVNLQIPHYVSTTHNGSHASYYPGAQQMSIQLAFAPDSGKIYGAQIVGYEGVDKRIDVISAAINHEQTIFDLTQFEHAYAPPFSSAKDPINIAAFVAENILLKKHQVFYVNEINNLPSNSVLLDVRTEDEFNEGHIPLAQNIPLDELRNRLNELDKNKTIYLYCLGGQRGYLAQQILNQNGFKQTFNLSGGYKLYQNYQTFVPSLKPLGNLV